MKDRTLSGCRILVVEDEYLLADELSQELTDLGAEVMGPVPHLEPAFSLVDSGSTPDGAILDVNLGGTAVFPLADMLIARGVPLVFTTGYDARALPERFADVPKCEKPVNMHRITAAMVQAIYG